MALEVDAFVSTGATLAVGKSLVMDGVTIGASTGVVEMIKLMDGTAGSSVAIGASSAAIGGVGLQAFVVNSTVNPIGVSIAAGQSTVTVSGNVAVTFSTASKLIAQISSADAGGSTANPLFVVNKPYAPAATWVNISTVATSTAILVLFSSAASTRYNLTSMVITNAGTVESVVRIFDGATTISALLWRSDLASAGGGVAISMPVPIRGSSGAAVVAKTVPASTVYVNLQGFKSA